MIQNHINAKYQGRNKQTQRLISHENPLSMDNDMSQIRNLLEDKFNEVNVKLSIITEALEIKEKKV